MFFLATLPATSVTIVGHLSSLDWDGVQNCLKAAISFK
jgi:hypothetical protein